MTVAVLPPATVAFLRPRLRPPPRSLLTRRQRASVLGHFTRRRTMPLRDARTVRFKTVIRVTDPPSTAPLDGAPVVANFRAAGVASTLPLVSMARTRNV